MRFYRQQHRFYCGVDLHARSMHVCIVDHDGQTKVHKNIEATPSGVLLDPGTWAKERDKYLPSAADGDFIASLMKPVTEAGVYANWISPPKVGIDNKPGDFEYVKIET